MAAPGSATFSELRLSNDSLPSQDHDPVLTLYAHYFLAADLMRSNYEKLEPKRKQRGRLSENENVNQGIYICTWLGLLGVTCEGFKKLRIPSLLETNRPDNFHELIPKTYAIGRSIK